MRKSIVVTVVLAVVLLGGAFAGGQAGVGDFVNKKLAETFGIDATAMLTGQKSTAAAAPQARQARAFPVETVQVRAGQSAADIRTVGSLQSDESVQISSEIAGRIADILFLEGQHVSQGDDLVRLDSSLTQAELDDARARLALAEANHDRTSVLAKGGNATQRANDEAIAARATARAAFALVDARFDKLKIRAPFDGVLGIRKVSVGAYVNPGVEIVNLEKIDQLKLSFNVPEIHLEDVSVGQTVTITVDALPQRQFTGTIYAINPMVDVNGRSLAIRARLPNTDLVLRPGLFARVSIPNSRSHPVVFIPEQAVVPRGADALVYRVMDGKAVETKVKLGARKAGEVEVTEGLPTDAVVVVAGQHRLQDGVAVDITPVVAEQQG